LRQGIHWWSSLGLEDREADQWTSTLERWAYPIIGELPVGGISTDLVLRILVRPIGP
jgi:hypothetical protein